jgi:glutamate---cysteine ligase / carboxylate-amine ligase
VRTGPDVQATSPSWARWNSTISRRYTLGVEEELVLLRPQDQSLGESSDWLLARLPPGLSEHASPETHAAVIELATDIHVNVAGVTAELSELRARLARELRAVGLVAASPGAYPLALGGEIRLSRADRYREVTDTMRALARRDPTMAIHVHVGVPDPEDAVRLLDGFRNQVPLLLALSANSPFCQGRDSGFASMRTAIFQGFPRTGTARWFGDYSTYIRAVDALVASGALPDPSFLWWDVRLQPRLGTVEVRVMDSQSTVADSTPLIALVQSLARLILEGGYCETPLDPEVLAENRFLAARDGSAALLIDPEQRRLVPAIGLIEDLVARCRPHAAALGCETELDQVTRLARASGAARQRALAEEAGLDALIAALSDCFAGSTVVAPSRRFTRSTLR